MMCCVLLFCACAESATASSLLENVSPISANGHVNVLIEIPAGTNEKWEVDKKTGQLSIEILDNGQPRNVNYLPYPANYGMIPKTILPKRKGGDGDPLDVIVLGESISRGTIEECKLIGVMKLLDRGEQDDKLIAVSKASVFRNINSLNQLDSLHNGVSIILKTWFENYKGKNKMSFLGFDSKEEANHILSVSMNDYIALKEK